MQNSPGLLSTMTSRTRLASGVQLLPGNKLSLAKVLISSARRHPTTIRPLLRRLETLKLTPASQEHLLSSQLWSLHPWHRAIHPQRLLLQELWITASIAEATVVARITCVTQVLLYLHFCLDQA